MKKLGLKAQSLLFTVSNLEKKHKIITYISLLFLTTSTYFLRTENQNVKIEVVKLKEKSISLKKNMIIFNRTYQSFPLPVWQKVKRGNRFIIQYVNPAYVKHLGHLFSYDIYSHIGKDNFDLFGDKYAQAYYEKDLVVAITGNDLNSIDEIFDKDGKKAYVKVLKWREINNDKDTIIYGMVKEFLKEKE